MIILQNKELSITDTCVYLNDKLWRFKYFFAVDVSTEELDELLSSGWRKFGIYFFKPHCESCQACIPLRVCIDSFTLSKSQKRIIKNGKDITVIFNELEYRDEIYEIYKKHSIEKFNIETNHDDFLFSFYRKSCRSLQSEYYVDNKLIGIGFIDISQNGLNSIYFAYDTEYSAYSLGTFSILKEIEYAKSLSLSYYYLGYWIDKNKSMAYKNQFKPNEKYDWQQEIWIPGSDYSLKP